MSHGSFVGRALLALGFLLAIASGSASVAAEDNPTTKQPVNPPAAAEKRGADVKLNDSVVFRVLLAHGQRSAEERAEAAARALEHALLGADPRARHKAQGAAQVIFAGETPVIELYAEDAAAAGDASLDVCTARIEARVQETLTTEKKRSDIAQTVFSISLVVFFGLIALFLARQVGDYAGRARSFVLEHPERIPALRLRTLEVIGSGALRGVLLGALIIGRAVLQIGLVYVWLVITLSHFDATRPYTERLTGLLTKPLLALLERFAFALPLGLLALCFGALVYVLVRFVELFFVSVRRGETRIAWLPSELVAPVSVLARGTIVICAVLLAGPIVTGDSDGALSRAGAILLFSLALAATPLAACVLLGVVQLLSRRLRTGADLELAGKRGRVTAIGFFDVTLQEPDGHSVRVPHLLALVSPLQMKAADARTRVAISVAPSAPPTAVKSLLLTAASELGARPEVELYDVDAGGAHFHVSLAPSASVTSAPEREQSASELRLVLAEALARAGFALGTRPEGPRR